MSYNDSIFNRSKYQPRAQGAKAERETIAFMTGGMEMDDFAERAIRRENSLTEEERKLLRTFDGRFDIFQFTEETVMRITRNTNRIIGQIKDSSA